MLKALFMPRFFFFFLFSSFFFGFFFTVIVGRIMSFRMLFNVEPVLNLDLDLDKTQAAHIKTSD